jgi:hypothetical protein
MQLSMVLREKRIFKSAGIAFPDIGIISAQGREVGYLFLRWAIRVCLGFV